MVEHGVFSPVNQRQMRLAEYAFGILHDLSGLRSLKMFRICMNVKLPI